MSAPFRGDLTSELQIQAEWLPLSTTEETGNSEILAYQLMWDNQSGVVDIIAQESDDLSKTLIGLVSS